MPEATLHARPAFAGHLPPGRHGRGDGPAGVLIAELDGLALVGVAARAGRAAELDEAAQRGFGCGLPRRPQAAHGPEVAFLWSGPGQWLARAEERVIPHLRDRLAVALGDMASLSEQSDGRAVLRLAGPRVRDTLAKLCPVDLHPRAFGAGDVAATLFAHMPVLVWQVDETPTYEIFTLRSLAGSFAEAVIGASAEFGVDIGSRAA